MVEVARPLRPEVEDTVVIRRDALLFPVAQTMLGLIKLCRAVVDARVAILPAVVDLPMTPTAVATLMVTSRTMTKGTILWLVINF